MRERLHRDLQLTNMSGDFFDKKRGEQPDLLLPSSVLLM
jgi:hypothetical protein